jgi:hypothetical protein
MKQDPMSKEDKGLTEIIEEFDEKVNVISEDDDFIEKDDVQDKDDE